MCGLYYEAAPHEISGSVFGLLNPEDLGNTHLRNVGTCFPVDTV